MGSLRLWDKRNNGGQWELDGMFHVCLGQVEKSRELSTGLIGPLFVLWLFVCSFSSYRYSNIKTQLFHIYIIYVHIFMYVINNQMVCNCFIQVNSLSRILNPWEAGKLRGWQSALETCQVCFLLMVTSRRAFFSLLTGRRALGAFPLSPKDNGSWDINKFLVEDDKLTWSLLIASL